MYKSKAQDGRSPNEERKKLEKIGSSATLDVFGDAPNKSCTILKKGLQSQGTLHMKVRIGRHIRWALDMALIEVEHVCGDPQGIGQVQCATR